MVSRLQAPTLRVISQPNYVEVRRVVGPSYVFQRPTGCRSCSHCRRKRRTLTAFPFPGALRFSNIDDKQLGFLFQLSVIQEHRFYIYPSHIDSAHEMHSLKVDLPDSVRRRSK